MQRRMEKEIIDNWMWEEKFDTQEKGGERFANSWKWLIRRQSD